MLKSRKQKILAAALLIIIAAGLIIRRNSAGRTEQTIREINPALGLIQSLISTTGVVEPQNRLEIKPPINGRIEEIKVEEGDTVKIGETLAWMSSTERAALLDAARAKGEESLKYWQQAYKATPLIAPIEAEVIVRAVEPGQTVTSADAVVVLSDRLIVKAQVDETDIGRVKLGQAAMVSLDAYPQIKVKARVDHISYESEIVNNVTIYQVDILPESVPQVFRSGMSANVEIVEERQEQALLVPLEALQRDQEGAFVLIRPQANRPPVKKRVELGIADDTSVEIISGIGPQDRIIIQADKYRLEDNAFGASPFMPFGRRRSGK